MYSRDSLTQLTFHYVNGDKESYNIYAPSDHPVTSQDVQQEMRRFLDQRWWVLHLPDETVCINSENILKVEIKPAIPGFQGESVFKDAQRVSTLNRMHSVKVGER
jgi:hypothetical protein